MIIRFVNHFVHDTPLNQLLEKRSQSKYKTEFNRFTLEYSQIKRAIPERFVIFNFPRSGSNFLCTMLNQHPDILCHQEVFNPLRIYYSKNFHTLSSEEGSISQEDLFLGKVGLGSKWQRDIDPEKFLIKLWQHNYGARAVGFNLFPTHVPNMASSLIQDKNVKKVLLLRRNKVKCYVSRTIARKTNSWGQFSQGSSKNTAKNSVNQVYVDSKDLMKWSQKYDQYFYSLRKKISNQDQVFFEVAYEDLAGAGSEPIKAQLLDFLGVPLQIDALTPLSRKQNPDDLSELIINYDQLRNQLKGTSLEPLLDA